MANRQEVNQASVSGPQRPFAVFHVNKQTPEEIHTETVMADGPEQARGLVQDKYRENVILHVRTIGVPETAPAPENKISAPLPGARFIKGEFRAVPFLDDMLPETIPD